MRNIIKRSYDNLKPNDVDYQKMLKNILDDSRRKQKNRRSLYLKLGAVAACLIIAALISIPLLFNNPDNNPNIKVPIKTPGSTNIAKNIQEQKISYIVVLSINPSVEFSVDEYQFYTFS